MKFERKAVSALLRYMRERQRVHDAKERGDVPPWTDDPILNAYRFCNVYREQDRVTQWIDENIRRPFANDPDLWFILCLARALNNPETLRELIDDIRTCWPRNGRWSEVMFRRVLDLRRARGLRYANPAYMTMGVIKWMGELWSNRVEARSDINAARTMAAMFAALRKHKGLGSFIACQIVADMRFTRYLRHAPDKLTWTAVGPGSSKGLNYMLGTPGRRWRQAEFIEACTELYRLVAPRWLASPLADANLPFELHEVENVLCEFSKYERTRLGEGRPKQQYRMPHYEVAMTINL